MIEIEYNDDNLQHLYKEMDPKLRMKALKSAFRREANRVRKHAVANLRGTGIRSNKAMEKCIRARVYKRVAGFKVTIAPKRSKQGKAVGYYRTKRGRELPVLIWLEAGTAARYQRRGKGFRGNGRYTGSLAPRLFMERARRQTRGTVTESLHNELRKSVERVARKCGCKV